MRKIIFSKQSWDEMRNLCEKGYPKEVCGLLFGTVENSVRKVMKVVDLINILDGGHESRLKQLVDAEAVALPKERIYGGGRTEFLIDPLEHYQKVRDAEVHGLEQVGLFHSHPDHPAIPSIIDSSQPNLAGWSNLILAVDNGKFILARSWFRENDVQTFQEENIIVE